MPRSKLPWTLRGVLFGHALRLAPTAIPQNPAFPVDKAVRRSPAHRRGIVVPLAHATWWPVGIPACDERPLARMEKNMIGVVLAHNEVGVCVVAAIAVNVVDDRTTTKGLPHGPFNDKDMLSDIGIPTATTRAGVLGIVDEDIPVAVNGASSFPLCGFGPPSWRPITVAAHEFPWLTGNIARGGMIPPRDCRTTTASAGAKSVADHNGNIAKSYQAFQRTLTYVTE